MSEADQADVSLQACVNARRRFFTAPRVEGRKAAVDLQERIIIDPEVLVGKPVIRGTRLAVEFVIDLLAHGWGFDDIVNNYPGLTRDDILACLAYASARLHDERVYPR
jgi:uncharacterized protein (DUF433 family)